MEVPFQYGRLAEAENFIERYWYPQDVGVNRR